jgi:hypothetical protein
MVRVLSREERVRSKLLSPIGVAEQVAERSIAVADSRLKASVARQRTTDLCREAAGPRSSGARLLLLPFHSAFMHCSAEPFLWEFPYMCVSRAR